MTQLLPVSAGQTTCALGVLLVAVLYYLPSPIDPKPYRFAKPPPRLEGPLLPNHRLTRIQKIHEDVIVGPESFTADKLGNIYTGSSDGKVWKFNMTHAQVLTRIGAKRTDCGTYELEPVCGRPKGMGVHPVTGQLYLLDSYKGMLRIDTVTGHTETVLSNVIDGIPTQFLNGLTITSGGDIYFTDSTSKWDRRNYRYEVIELNSLGRLLHYSPTTGEVTTLLSGLYLPNGIALSADESFLVFAQMTLHRLNKYYLTGPKAGQLETLTDNLPGYPDNVQLTSRGTFYVGLSVARFEGSSPLGSFLDIIAPYPAIKRFIAKVTPWEFYNMVQARHAILVEVDADGHIIHSFHDPEGATIRTGLGEAFEHGGAIYTGHFAKHFVGYITTEDLYKD